MKDDLRVEISQLNDRLQRVSLNQTFYPRYPITSLKQRNCLKF